MELHGDQRRSSPAAQRNKGPLLDVLRRALPQSGVVLEVASGTGEHADFFARALPQLTWQPSDPSELARASISAWRTAQPLPNLLPPLDLDARAETWPVEHADAIVCINMVHISPWEATRGLLRNAERLLAPSRPLILYGPYFQAGVEPAPSNVAFDADLRRRDARWGLRSVEEVTGAATARGLELTEIIAMPANNLFLILRRL